MDARGSPLHVRGHYPGVIAEILVKGVAIPMSFDLHNIKGDPSEKILQGGSYTDKMTFHAWEASSQGCFQHSGSESLLCHWYHCSLVVQVAKKIKIGWWVVDLKVSS